MRKLLFSVLFSLILIYPVGAQNKKSNEIIRIVGQLINKNTNTPISFANVGVVNTYLGAATNIDGYFEFKIPEELKDKDIQASAVGFSTFTASIEECRKKDSLRIYLIPKNYDINEVKIQAASLVLQTRIKKAIEKISENYIQTPFNYDVYYRSETIENNQLSRLHEAAVRIYDSKGYKRTDQYQVFKERAYKFLQVKKNFENKSLIDGATYLDELLEMDIVRGRGNILNKNHINFYDLKLDQISEYENDSIWIISYNSKKPMLSNTGDYYANSYSGKLYIKCKNFAVIKNETKVIASNYSSQGRSFYINEDRQDWKPEKIEYQFNVIYKEQAGKYYLSYVNYNRQHQLKNKKTGESKIVDRNTEMSITKIITKNPEVISNRTYYEDMNTDEKFWDSFSILLNTNK